MVFCFENWCDLMWEKNCSVDRENFCKFEAESLRSLEQFIKTLNEQLLKQNTAGFYIHIQLGQLKCQLEQIIGL